MKVIAMIAATSFLAGCCRSNPPDAELCIGWLRADEMDRAFLKVDQIDDHSDKPQTQYERDRRQTRAWMSLLNCPREMWP